MRTIKLCHGPGNGRNEACLMAASNMIICDTEEMRFLQETNQLDTNNKVCPILREFIVLSNDAIPLDLLGLLYTPFIWEIVGTNSNSYEIEKERVNILYDWAINEYRCNGYVVEDELLSSAINISSKIMQKFTERICNKNDEYVLSECKKLVQIMWDLINCGDKRPVEKEFVLTHDELADKLELVS